MDKEELFKECDKEIKGNGLKEGIIFAKNALNNASWGVGSDGINQHQFKTMFLVFASNLLHSHESQFPINIYVDKIKKYKQAEKLENLGLYDPQNLSFKEKAILTRVLQLLRRNNGDTGLELTNQFNTELAISIVKEYKNLSFLEKEFYWKDIECIKTGIENFSSKKDGEIVICLLNLLSKKEKSLDKDFIIKIIRNNFDNPGNLFTPKIIETLRYKFKIDWDGILYDVMGNVSKNVNGNSIFSFYLLKNPNPMSFEKKEKIKNFFDELKDILLSIEQSDTNDYEYKVNHKNIGRIHAHTIKIIARVIQSILEGSFLDKTGLKEKINLIIQKCPDLPPFDIIGFFEARDDKLLYIFSDDDLKTLFRNNSLPFNLNTTDIPQSVIADFHASLRRHIETKRPWLRRFLIEEDARNIGQNRQNRPYYWREDEAVMNINTTAVVSEIGKMFPADKTPETAKTIVYEALEKSAYCNTKIQLDDALSTFNQADKEYIKDKISKLESERDKAYTVNSGPNHTQAILDQVFALERQLKKYMSKSIKLEEYIQAIINKTRILTQLARLKDKMPLIVSVIENTWEKEKNEKGEEIPLKENYEPFFMGLYQGAVSNPRGENKNNPDRIDQVCQIYLFLSTALESYVGDLLNTFNLVANSTVNLSPAELDCANNLKKMFLNKQRMIGIITQNDPKNTLINELRVTSLEKTKFKENAIKAIEGMIRWYKRIHGDQVLLNEVSAEANSENELKEKLEPLMCKISYAFTTEEDVHDSINQVFGLLKTKILDGIRLLVAEDPIEKINEIRNIVHNEFKYFGMNYLVQNHDYYEKIVESNINSLLKELKIEKYTKKQIEEMEKEKYELTEFVKRMLKSKSNPDEKKLITWLDVYKKDNSTAINEIVRSYNEFYEPHISANDVKLTIDGLGLE